MKAVPASVEHAHAHRKAELPVPAFQGLMAVLLAAAHKSRGCVYSKLGLLAVPEQEHLTYCLGYDVTSVNSTRQQKHSNSPVL